MPAPSIGVPLKEFNRRNATYVQIAGALGQLTPNFQRLVAEMLLVRLFDDLQESLAGVAYRLACGALYLNGNAPTLLVPAARSATAARALYESQGRQGRQRYCKWSRSSYINETTRYVLDPTETFNGACAQHSLVLSEMQAVRNRIAHKNAASKSRFDPIVRRYYGGNPRGITPGALLLSSRKVPNLLSTYLVASRVLVKDCCGS